MACFLSMDVLSGLSPRATRMSTHPGSSAISQVRTGLLNKVFLSSRHASLQLAQSDSWFTAVCANPGQLFGFAEAMCDSDDRGVSRGALHRPACGAHTGLTYR